MRLRIISGFVESKNFDKYSLSRMKALGSEYFLSVNILRYCISIVSL